MSELKKMIAIAEAAIAIRNRKSYPERSHVDGFVLVPQDLLQDLYKALTLSVNDDTKSARMSHAHLEQLKGYKFSATNELGETLNVTADLVVECERVRAIEDQLRALLN